MEAIGNVLLAIFCILCFPFILSLFKSVTDQYEAKQKERQDRAKLRRDIESAVKWRDH